MTPSPLFWIARHARRGDEWLVRSRYADAIAAAGRKVGNPLSIRKSRQPGYHVVTCPANRSRCGVQWNRNGKAR